MASRRIRRTSSFTGFLAATAQDVNTSIKRNDITAISAGVIGGDNFSEEIQVVDKALQSDNYVPSEAGWKIDGSGNAEFANVYVRGDINAQTGTIGYWNISTPSVTRTVGTNTLFGTFLESQNLGSSDEGAAGTYVSLFKSYIQPDGALSAIARDADGNAIVTVVNHNYLVGDLVTVTVDDVSGFSTGSTPVRITATTTDTFSYESAGSVVAETETTGTVVFVNPDVSGLYLRDYTKANFDYGYISNTGLAYVSAETLNLVYNPSFEFTDINTYDISACTASSTTVATYTVDSTAAANPFVVGQRIDVVDVDPIDFNGRFYVTNIGGSSGAWTVVVTDPGAPFTAATSGTTFGSITSESKPSTASWDTSAGGALSSWSFISTSLRDYASASDFGAYAVWTTTPPTYKFRTTVSYSSGDAYKLFTGDRPLHFNYETFLNYQPFQSTVSNFVTTNASVCTITTSAVHGLTAGDIVYLDFTATGATTLSANEDWASYEYPDYSRLFEVLSTPTTTTFTIVNNQGEVAYAGITRAGIQPRGGGTARAQNVYKVIWPVIDLSEVLFVFPNATTTSLYSVLDSATKAEWDADANFKYKTINPNHWMLEYLDPVDGIGPLTTGQIVLDGSALRDVYASSDSTNFLAKADIKLQIPAKPYSQTYANATSDPVAYASTTGAITSSNAAVTAISYGGGYITYTGAHNFLVGDYVSVTGATSSQYNITNERIAFVGTSPVSFTVQKTVTAGTTSTANAVAYKNVNTIIDEVSISTEPVSFYGNTSDSYYWKDNTLNSPSQVSIQGPKKWIDIDLATQTGTLSNLDYVGFKSSHLTHPMVSKPSISTIPITTSNAYLLFDMDDYEELKISSGIFSKADITDTGVISFESYTKMHTGDTASMAEMVSYAYDKTASISTYAEYKNSRAVISADYIHIEGTLLATNIYPNYTGFGAAYGYDATPITDGGNLNIYGAYVNIGDSSDLIPTTLYANGDARFEKDAYVTGVSYLGAVETTGTIQVNTSNALYATADTTQTGIWLDDNNTFGISRSTGIVMYVKRVGNDGTLISLNSQGVQQGSISIAGTLVSYNTFLGSHYSEMAELAPLKGTIMESSNDLVENKYNSQDRLPKVKVSDTAASTKVYGVYLGVDRDDGEGSEEDGHLIAAIGACWIRIASGVSVQTGDLIQSNGDGCGRVQSDDIIRSSTVGKVTSNVVIETYEDGSYLVPCVLYCG